MPSEMKQAFGSAINPFSNIKVNGGRIGTSDAQKVTITIDFTADLQQICSFHPLVLIG